MSKPKYRVGQLSAFAEGKLKLDWTPIVIYVTDKKAHTRVRLSQLEIKQAIIKLAQSKERRYKIPVGKCRVLAKEKK